MVHDSRVFSSSEYLFRSGFVFTLSGKLQNPRGDCLAMDSDGGGIDTFVRVLQGSPRVSSDPDVPYTMVEYSTELHCIARIASGSVLL